ncbi:MAG: PAS domain S-box protein [Acidobacteria bacterium]|nr:PAS domain S-box protein [Acidobacteriota bacterium]
MLDAALEGKLKRLMFLRVVMITTLLLIAVYVETVSETLLRVNPLYFLIAATYGLTLLHVLALRLVMAGAALVYAQVVGDLAIITGLVYLTGGTGTRTGFMLLYPISVLSGSVLLSRGKGMVLAGTATLFYGAVLWTVRQGLVPPWGLADVPSMPAKHLVYSIFVTGVGCATVAMIGGYLSESLKRAGERLEVAAEQVADLQELNKVIVDSIHSGLLTADAAGRVLHVNPIGASILGLRSGAIVGRTVHEIFGSVLLEPSALKARARDRGLSRLELSYEATGAPLELGISVSALQTAEPGREGFLLVFQDVTEVKRLEHEVRTKEKLAAVGEMAAHLAHEIRNPLGSISGSAQVLMTEPNMSAEQARLLAIITRESQRLSAALNRFLFQVRPALSPPGPVDVGLMVSQNVTLLRNSPEVGPNHVVEFEADGGPHVCLADPDQITQVFWNLARNALEAMPDGGTLRLHLRAAGGSLVLSVRDQGRGMGREEQRRIFEPFRSGTAMGTGLGLAIVYRIVREHKGDITVRSIPSQGTEVEVRLPLVAQPVPA